MKLSNNNAVSPVIGVMLMLIVTIIIAAVVSGFGGSLIGTTQKAPTLTMDVNIINMGSWTGSGFYANVRTVSQPIPTSNIKIVTSWTATNGGNPVSGGNTIVPNVVNTFYWVDPQHSSFGQKAESDVFAPFGNGPGINGSTTFGGEDTNANIFSKTDQMFGNYTLVPGTSMNAPAAGAATPKIIGGTWHCSPTGCSSTQQNGGVAGQGINGDPSGTAGYGVYGLYSYTSQMIDPVTAVLGANWNLLRAGDKVNVKIIYIPTGSVIFNKDVTVTEGSTST